MRFLFFSQLARRNTVDLLKHLIEGALTLKATLKGDLRDGLRGLLEQLLGVFQTVLIEHRLEIIAKRLIKDLGKIMIVVAELLCNALKCNVFFKIS